MKTKIEFNRKYRRKVKGAQTYVIRRSLKILWLERIRNEKAKQSWVSNFHN